jgi:NTE family protein
MKINDNLRYALVLSGGGARSLVHVGILSALEKAGYPPPSLVAGASMGAIVGGLYASGMKVEELRHFILEELDVSMFMESAAFKMTGSLGKFLQKGQALGAVASKPGSDSGNKVLTLLESFSGGKRIEDCSIPFLCNAVDICSGEELIFTSGSLARAIRASMSFPLVFEPFIDGDLCLVDGGVVDNLPVKAAREAGAKLGIKRMLAVDTRVWRRVSPEHFKNGINVLMRCFDVLMRKTEQYRPAELTLGVSDRSSVFDFSRKQELLALGEAAVRVSGTELDAFFGAGIRSALDRRKYRACGLRLDGYYGAPGEVKETRQR